MNKNNRWEKFYLCDTALVHCKSLKELRSVTRGFGMLNDHSDASRFGAISDFDPVATETCEEG